MSSSSFASRCLPDSPASLVSGAADRWPHAVPPVQGRVGVLEDDLQRPQLIAGPLAPWAPACAVSSSTEPVVRRRQPEQHPGQRGLSAARLTDQAEGLAGAQVEIDAGQGVHRFLAGPEGLRHVPQGDDRCRGLIRRREPDVLWRDPWKLGRPLVVVTARDPVGAHRVHRWRLPLAALLGDRAPIGEDAARRHRAGRGQEAGDRVQAAVVLALAPPRDAAQQPDRVRVPGLRRRPPRRSLLHELARVHYADAVAHLARSPRGCG